MGQRLRTFFEELTFHIYIAFHSCKEGGTNLSYQGCDWQLFSCWSWWQRCWCRCQVFQLLLPRALCLPTCSLSFLIYHPDVCHSCWRSWCCSPLLPRTRCGHALLDDVQEAGLHFSEDELFEVENETDDVINVLMPVVQLYSVNIILVSLETKFNIYPVFNWNI